jgi:hypothetical protein
MVDCRRQGLCFKCDEKFVRGHKCTHLFFIEYDDSTADEVVDSNDTPGDDESCITRYAVAGVQAADTVRLRVFVQGQELLALVDSGSSQFYPRRGGGQAGHGPDSSALASMS